MIDPNRKVRVALNNEGKLIRAGDPELKECDSEYLELIRKGYTVKVITYSEYIKLEWA